jgi:hypothetical protein
MSAPRDHDGNVIDLDRRLERAIGRVQCSACKAPKALAPCRHVIVTDERIVISKDEWRRLTDELAELRTLEADVIDGEIAKRLRS